MKFLHLSDVHLSSKIKGDFSLEVSKNRKLELFNTFKNALKYAYENNFDFVLLGGDIFDTPKPLLKDLENFLNLIKYYEKINFYYVLGNHDLGIDLKDVPSNLKLFRNDNFVTYEDSGALISGVNIDEFNYESYYDKLKLPSDKFNIVLLHGEASSVSKIDKINLKKLQNKNIHYLALGHIHKYYEGRLDEEGIYINPGCLEGRGFDELGEKGVVEVRVEDSLKVKFIPLQKRQIVRIKVDITGDSNLHLVSDKIKRSLDKYPGSSIVEVILTGESEFELDLELLKLDFDFYYFNIVNNTFRKVAIENLKSSPSLKGEFVRNVLDNKTYDPKKKEELLRLGLNLLEGRGI